jgi:spore coat protein H
MLHEALGYQVYSKAGVPVPETVYARLTVNEKPYGLYLLVETIDRRFLKRRFGDDSGILYEAAYGTDLTDGNEKSYELDEGEDPDHAALTRLIRAVNSPGDGVFYGNSALIDTRSFLAMMAVEA